MKIITTGLALMAAMASAGFRWISIKKFASPVPNLGKRFFTLHSANL
jgi:hypothetical protein